MVTWKSVQTFYKRLQEHLERNKGLQARVSSVGGEIGETEELLSMTKEAGDDMLEERNKKKRKIAEEEEKKERLSAFIRQRQRIGAQRKGRRES